MKVCLDQMHPAKAPGIDGMPALFYQTPWPVVGEKTIEACLDLTNNSGDFSQLNLKLISLIPNDKEPTLCLLSFIQQVLNNAMVAF